MERVPELLFILTWQQEHTRLLNIGVLLLPKISKVNLLGNATGLQKKLDVAETHYLDALAIDPDFARSRFGIAEVQFQRARGPSCGGTDAPEDLPLMEEALARFQEVTGLEAPPLSFLPARAQVARGRILLCMSLYGADTLEEARNEFEAVIAEHGTNERLRDLIAVAHANLARVHVFLGSHQAAVEEYRLAVDLTFDDARRAAFHTAIGDLLNCRLDEPGLAELEYEIAASLVDPPLPRADCPDGSA